MHRLRHANSSLKKELKRSQKKLAQATADGASAESRISALKEDKARLTEELASTTDKLNTCTSRREAVEAELRDVTAKYNQAAAELAKALANIKSLTSQLEETGAGWEADKAKHKKESDEPDGESRWCFNITKEFICVDGNVSASFYVPIPYFFSVSISPWFLFLTVQRRPSSSSENHARCSLRHQGCVKGRTMVVMAKQNTSIEQLYRRLTTYYAT